MSDETEGCGGRKRKGRRLKKKEIGQTEFVEVSDERGSDGG